METDIKRIMIKLYCMFTCVMKIHKRTEGVGTRFAILNGVIRRDVYETMTFE